MAAPEILEVRCAGCGETLEVEQGMTEFACPGCAMPQALPPELMPPPRPRPRRALPLPGPGGAAGPTGSRMPCGGCGAVLAVPWGLRRLVCPICATDLSVDGDRLRLHHAAPPGGVHVVSPAGIASVAPMAFHRSEVQEEPITQAIRVGQVQVGRYNKPVHFEQTRGPFPARSVHREESTNSPRSHTKTAVYVGCAKDAPVNQSFHGEESHMKLLNETVPRHDFGMKARLSATPGSICGEKVRVEHPGKVSHAPRSQGWPSDYSVNTELVHGPRNSNTIGIHGNQKVRHASISCIAEQETVKRPGPTASAEQMQVNSRGNTTEWNKKRKRSSRSTGGKHKRKNRVLSSSNEELHLTCNKHSAPQPEATRKSNNTQEPGPYPHENQFDPADIDPAEATCALANRSFNSAQEHEMPQESSNGIHPHEKSGAQVLQNPSLGVMHGQQIQNDSHSEQVEVECHHNNIGGHHKSTAKDFMHLSDEGNSIENRSYTGTHQQVTLATACCDHTSSSPLLSATPLPSTTLPSVLTSPSVHQQVPHCQPPETRHPQGAQAARIGYMKSKKRRGRGPTKLIEPRKEADRPVLTPNNVDTWDIHPPCPKVASTITALLKQWHPGSTYMPANQQTNEMHQGELVLHFHQYHSDARAVIMDEFLQRYKWASGREVECLKLFNRRTVRQFTGLLCDEKRRARVELAASRKVKGAVVSPNSNRQTNLDDEDARKKLKQSHRDPAAVGQEDDDPLQWKPFPPEWMLPKWWEMLCEHWASEEILQVSAQKRKNRYTGGSAQHTAGSRSITMHRKLMIIENDGKPVSEVEVFNKTHKRGGGKGEFVTEKARRTVEGFQRRLEETGGTEVDPHLLWAEEVGGRNRGRYYGLHGIIDKARIGTLSKSIPRSLGGKTRQQMFTPDQVQEMINRATQQLNETWENRFQSLEQSMRGMMPSDVPQHAPCSSTAGPGADDDQALLQNTLDSADEGTYQSAEDDTGELIGD